MRKNQPRMEERIERRISAITSISMCALTVIAQIATTLILTHFLRGEGQLRLHGAGAFGCCRSHSGVSALWQPQL